MCSLCWPKRRQRDPENLFTRKSEDAITKEQNNRLEKGYFERQVSSTRHRRFLGNMGAFR